MITTDELLSLGEALRAHGLDGYSDQIIEIFPFLSTEERLLLIDLVGRFTVCEFTDYYYLGQALSSLLAQSLSSHMQHVVLLPLVNPTGQVKPKSGEGVAWLMSREMESQAKSSGRTFKMLSRTVSPDVLKKSDATAFVFVDDFVGSGDTAESAIKWLSSQGVNSKNIIVGCFLGLQSGADKIMEAGAVPVFMRTINRGISDADHILDKNSALQMMTAVEERNGVTQKFRLGYKGGEALALMCFCPNNTFPIFWWNGPLWKGPLSR